MSASKKKFVPINEAAILLGVHADTIRRWISDGSLTGYRLGPRLIRLDACEVEALARPIPSAKSGGARRAS